MADMIAFDLVSPDCRLAEGEASEVRLPGAEGDLSVMAGHTALVLSLRPGIVSLVTGTECKNYAVTGGFAEITAARVAVLADWAKPEDETKAAHLDEMIAEASTRVDNSQGSARDRNEKYLADLGALQSALG